MTTRYSRQREFVLFRPACNYDRLQTARMILNYCVLEPLEALRVAAVKRKMNPSHSMIKIALTTQEETHIPVVSKKASTTTLVESVAASSPSPHQATTSAEEQFAEEVVVEIEVGDRNWLDSLDDEEDQTALVEQVVDEQEFQTATTSNIIDNRIEEELERCRALLILDGEYFQLTALFEFMDGSHFNFLKLPAGTSFINQPNDVAPCFRVMKSVLKSKKFVVKKSGNNPPDYLENLKDAPRETNLDAASRTSFLQFFEAIPNILHQTFSSANIIDGWKTTGLFPFSLDKILRRCTGFADLTSGQQDAITNGVPALVKIARCKGKIRDDEMVAAIDGAYTGHEKDTRDYTSCPLNYDRALWLNHAEVISIREERIRTKKRSSEVFSASVCAADQKSKPIGTV